MPSACTPSRPQTTPALPCWQRGTPPAPGEPIRTTSSPSWWCWPPATPTSTRPTPGRRPFAAPPAKLGDQHTYALPRGDRLTLAVGDVVRVRVNDYRSRKGRGPDLLNGYRADLRARADAFALYPGITRAREANHLWLPVAALEDEETRIRLGAARSDAERLERAVAAYARLLRQDRPEGMVSDQLREPPAPAAAAVHVPEQHAARAHRCSPRTAGAAVAGAAVRTRAR